MFSVEVCDEGTNVNLDRSNLCQPLYSPRGEECTESWHIKLLVRAWLYPGDEGCYGAAEPREEGPYDSRDKVTVKQQIVADACTCEKSFLDRESPKTVPARFPGDRNQQRPDLQLEQTM